MSAVASGSRDAIGSAGVAGASRAGASYPPPAPRPVMPPTAAAIAGDAAAAAPPSPTTAYLIHTETSSLHDLRLQISLAPPASAAAAPQKQPLRPLFFRERELSDQGEIVDHLVNASSAYVPWSIHKPARGWYLRLRSPALPKGTALPFRPPRKAENGTSAGASGDRGAQEEDPAGATAGPSRSPLLISLPLTLHLASLRRAKETIDDALDTSAGAHNRTQSLAGRAKSIDQLAEVSLCDSAPAAGAYISHSRGPSASASRRPHGRTLSGAHKKDDNAPDEDESFNSSIASTHALTPRIITDDADTSGEYDGGATTATATATARSSAALGHTRRRSGGSGSHRIEVRKVSNEPREALLRERVEEEDEQDAEAEEQAGQRQNGGSGKGRLQVDTREQLQVDTGRLSPGNIRPLGRDVLGAASAGADAGVSGSTPTYSADRPYSPTEPSAFHPLAGDDDPEGTADEAGSRKRHAANGRVAAGSAGRDQAAAGTDGPHSAQGGAFPNGGARQATARPPLIGGRTAPVLCHFVLLDGVDAASYEARRPFLPPSARRREESSSRSQDLSARSGTSRLGSTLPQGGAMQLESVRRRWASWAWSKLPSSIRPGALPLDTSHDFSLHWTNPPAHLQDPSAGGNSGGGRSIEVLRFRDLEGWTIFSSWSAQRRGRLEMQEDAVRALGLDRAFWFAVALAYLDFLEGRD
ncbi:hypothetical protein OC844_007311, partial [Tilletia horrida]